MGETIEALVGHVFIVGGRAVSATPPGALVELPPRKAPRGRDQDTFFTLITPAGTAQAQASFYEQLARLAAEVYFRSGGSVTSGLRESINGVNSYLMDHNQVAGQRYSLNIGCVVLRGHEIFTARTGECLCLLKQGPQFTTYPDSLTEPYSGPLLGHSPVIDIKLSRHEVATGHVLMLTDTGYAHAERDHLSSALGGGGIQRVLEHLKPLGSVQTQAMVIQFAAADDPDLALINAGSGIKVLRSSNAPTAPSAPKTGGLSLPALPTLRPKLRTEPLPSVTAPAAPAPPAAQIAPTIAAAQTTIAGPVAEPAPTLTQELAAVSPRELTVAAPLTAVTISPTLGAEASPAAPAISAATRGGGPAGAQAPSTTDGRAAVANEGELAPEGEALLGATLAAGPAADPATEPAAPVPPEILEILEVPELPELPELPEVPRQPAVVKVAGAAASILEKTGKGLTLALDRMLPEAAEEGPRVPSMVAAAMAVLIPVIVVFVIVATRLAQVDTSQFEQMVRNVEEAAAQARTVPLDDAKNAHAAWVGVLQRIEEAEQSTGRSNDPTLAAIRAEAQRILDQFAMVTRRDAVPLRTFDGAPDLRAVVVRAQTDLYTLDIANAAIWHDRLNPTDKSVFRRSSAAVVVRGQAVNAFSVRSLIDMAWMADGSSKNRVVALDSQGILVTYSPVFAPATATRLAGVEQWVDPVAMTVWRDRLYVLDVGANQIWRYTPVGASYPTPPDPYFEEPIDLSQAVDMGIDATPGNVYILFADGKVRKFLAGREQPFDFAGMPEDGLKAGGMLYLDADAIFPAMYIVDPRDQAIYQLTLRGQFQRRFKARETATFRNLTSVYVDGDDVYATTTTSVYYFSIADVRLGAPATP
jgi:hypothetical protein